MRCVSDNCFQSGQRMRVFEWAAPAVSESVRLKARTFDGAPSTNHFILFEDLLRCFNALQQHAFIVERKSINSGYWKNFCVRESSHVKSQKSIRAFEDAYFTSLWREHLHMLAIWQDCPQFPPPWPIAVPTYWDVLDLSASLQEHSNSFICYHSRCPHSFLNSQHFESG